MDDGIRADGMSTITHTSTGYSGAHHDEVSVTIDNTTTPGYVFSSSPLPVTEGGTSTTFASLNLSAQPFSGMDVTFTFTDDSDKIEFSPTFLTFDMVNWRTRQDLGVKGLEDTDRTDETVTATVTITSSDTDYTDLTAPTFTVTVTDNDMPGVVFAPSTLTVTEGEMGVSIGAITLAAQPFMDVTVIFTDDTNKIAFSPTSMTFTMGNWDTPRDLAVRGLEDGDPINEVVDVTTSTQSSDSAYHGLDVPTFQVNVTDNDTREVIISETALTVIEGGDASESSKQYTIRLATLPTDRVRVTLFDNDGDDFTASGPRGVSRVVFTTDNWGAEQLVTVTATDDRIDEDDETSDIRHVVSGGDYAGVVTAPNVSITVTDNDTAAVIVDGSQHNCERGRRRRRKLYRQARLTANGNRHNYAQLRCGRDGLTVVPRVQYDRLGNPQDFRSHGRQ